MNQFLIPTFIPDSTPPYPLRVVSRNLPASRSNRLRVSWFVLGMAFGIGCAGSFSPGIDTSSWVSNHEKVMPAFDNALSAAIESTSRTMSASVNESKSTMERTLNDIVASVSDGGASVETATHHAPARTYPLSLDLKVQRGDTLISMLNDVGISYDEARAVVDSIRPVYNPRRLTAGQNISVHLSKEPGSSDTPVISKLSIPISNTSSVELKQLSPDDKNGYDVRKVDVPVEQKLVRSGGMIDSSLYDTGIKAGIPPALISELITAYSYDVDFQRDIKQGNSMDVLFERQQTLEGEATGYGSVLFAELELGSRSIKIYRYVDKDGNADYYNENGESLRKALLRTPINGARITSKFGKRTHPILGYTKMHKGIDFGAPTGTPIYAAGDGIVQFVGKRGGYGNYIRIKHNGTYSSAYGHISRFASGMASGKKVKQGQIIAYVGSTGQATGPHLHYEILAHNQQVNPAGIKFKTGTVLKGHDLVAFRKSMSNINAKLAQLERHKPLVVAKASH
jgi:murein DD-endopeptidase MepM/ murein hydrolase activator NlpD